MTTIPATRNRDEARQIPGIEVYGHAIDGRCPDVWWGETGIDADLGLQPLLYAFVPKNPNQKED